MALSVVKVGAKFAIAGGAIYYSVQQGVWGTIDEGTNAMIKMTSVIDPSIMQKSKEMPSSEVLNTSLTSYWNTGVKTIFTSGSQLPETLPELSKAYTEKATGAVSNLLKQQDS